MGVATICTEPNYGGSCKVDTPVYDNVCYNLMEPARSFKHDWTMNCVGHKYVSPLPLRRVRFSDARPLAILNCRDQWCKDKGQRLFATNNPNEKPIISYLCRTSEYYSVSFRSLHDPIPLLTK